MREVLEELFRDVVELQARFDDLKSPEMPNVPSLEYVKIWIKGQVESGRV